MSLGEKIGIARAMRRLLSDETLRAGQRARGLEHAAGYSWQRTARETLALYESLMAN
ncbi:MAG: hypothetical protein IIB87_02265 [Chloroflexi bacterium]|nr:hypothetical protein [Chloroflexota bacterium]